MKKISYSQYFQAGLLTNYVDFTNWEWEEGFEIIVFEQIALSNYKQILNTQISASTKVSD